MPRVVVVTPPAPVVSLDEAKAHLRVEHADDDALITGMVAAATAHIDGPDGWLGRSIGVQTVETRFTLWEVDRVVPLPCRPVLAIEAVEYLDRNDAEREADLDDLELIGDAIYPSGSSFPWEGGSLRNGGLRIRYRAGYELLPAPIRVAILMMTEDLYRNRGEAIIGTITSTLGSSLVPRTLLGSFRVYC